LFFKARAFSGEAEEKASQAQRSLRSGLAAKPEVFIHLPTERLLRDKSLPKGKEAFSLPLGLVDCHP